jgi:hypothetical protein
MENTQHPNHLQGDTHSASEPSRSPTGVFFPLRIEEFVHLIRNLSILCHPTIARCGPSLQQAWSLACMLLERAAGACGSQSHLTHHSLCCSVLSSSSLIVKS